MKLIVGLGNPGAQYENTRHNIGFMAVDAMATGHGFSPWRKRFQGLVAEGRLGSTRVTLLKPQTFMNLSGQSVGEAMRYLKLEPADVIVLHDELDLAPGKLRLKVGGGHAGHNGLRSITQHIGADFARVRLGIGHPGRKELVAGFVLHPFARADQDWLDDLMRGIDDGATALAAGDGPRFQNAVANRVAPPRNKGPKVSETPPASEPTPKPHAPARKASGMERGDTQPSRAPDTRNALQRLKDHFS